MYIIKNLPALALITLLSACGGRGGGANHQPDTTSTPTQVNHNSNKNTYIAPKLSIVPPQDTLMTETINGHTFKGHGTVDFSKVFPLGYHESKGTYQETYINGEEKYKGYKTVTEIENLKVYHLPHSIIIGGVLIELYHDNQKIDLNTLDRSLTQFQSYSAFGEFTKPEIVNKMTGNFHYKGIAFNGSGKGVLSYHVDFGSKTGSGRITGLKEHGDITLHQAKITDKIDSRDIGGNDKTIISGIEGKATGQDLGVSAKYRLGFFGPKAEEIAGHIETQNQNPTHQHTFTSYPIGFAGSRQ